MPRLFSPTVAGLILTALQLASGADFTVINANGTGPGSLGQAITDANNLPGADRILFNIPGAGVQKIVVGQTPLPRVLESLVIDGYSQPGVKPNSLAVGNNAIILIQIDGAEATTPITGLYLDGGLDQNGLPAHYTVLGLSLTGFSTALAVAGESSLIAGNFIGLLPDGETARGNYRGISSVSPTIIGGTDPASRNVISGNTFHGWASWVGAGTLAGNYIGTNASGTKALPNTIGVYVEGASNRVVGGTAPGAGNLISGNTTAIRLGTSYFVTSPFPHTVFNSGSDTRIQGNLIGVAADGLSPLPNKYSIDLNYGANNIIGGLEPGAPNVIAFNGSGIRVSFSYSFCAACGSTAPPRSEGNQILSNSIHANAGLAIDLRSDGPTPNDAGDPDIGPNTLQNSPVINSAQIANGSVTITGTLNSTANTQFTLQYFSESLSLTQPRQTYLGSTNVTTDADGNATFSASFPLTETNVSFNMTATSPLGNTSEFSHNAGGFRNISTRSQVQSGDNAMIAGLILTERRFMLFRALGPALSVNGVPIAGRLSDPVLELYSSTGTLLAANDNWRDSPSANYLQTTWAPKDDLESAFVMNLGPGSFTAVVRGKENASGIALAEVYDLTAGGTNPPANLSTRGPVGSGDDVMIGGFIIEHANRMNRIVARAIGPSLSNFNIANPLPDPVLELHDSQGTTVATNDDWRATQEDDLSTIGLAPTNDREAAILIRLRAGAYTAIVRSKDNRTGIALVEIYNLY